MTLTTTRTRYTRPAIAFHWLLALLITGAVLSGTSWKLRDVSARRAPVSA